MAGHDVWDSVRKEAEDRVRQDHKVKQHDDCIDAHPELAKAFGLEKIGYDPMEHLKNEIAASFASGIRFNNDEAKDYLDSMRPLREAVEKDLYDPGWRDRERQEKERERYEEWKQEHPEEYAEEQKKNKTRAVMRTVWFIIGAIFGGAIGGFAIKLLCTTLDNAFDTAIVNFTAIPAIAIGICCLTLAWRKNGCIIGFIGGCGGLIGGAIGVALFLWLLSAIPIIASIVIGVVIGALIGGCVVGEAIWNKIYNNKWGLPDY